MCLLCEGILKQIPAFNCFCASLEEEVWEDIQVVPEFGWGGKEDFLGKQQFCPLKLYNLNAIFARYGYVNYRKKTVKNGQKRTRERMSDQEAKEIKAEAREIMPQPSTVNCS
ncbi:hypothetical protein Tco_0117110 [Tanacetum coccineum]